MYSAFFPFGRGTRRCLGENMSLNEQVIILVGMSFDIELLNAKEVEPLNFFTLTPFPVLRAKVTLRE